MGKRNFEEDLLTIENRMWRLKIRTNYELEKLTNGANFVIFINVVVGTCPEDGCKRMV